MTDKQGLDISTGKVYYDRENDSYLFVTSADFCWCSYYYIVDPDMIFDIRCDNAEEHWEEV